MSYIESRIKIKEIITKGMNLKDGEIICPLEMPDAVTFGKSGSEMVYISAVLAYGVQGEVMKGCYPMETCLKTFENSKDQNTIDLVLKKVPLRMDISLFQKNMKIFSQIKKIKKPLKIFPNILEFILTSKCSELVLRKISPHFQIIYNYSLCPHALYLAKSSLKNYSLSSFITLSEFINGGTLEGFTSSRILESNEWYNLYFQIFASIFAMQVNFGIVHNDLHWNNIMIYNVPKGGYWKYVFKHPKDKHKIQEFNLPNLGFFICIIDFGLAFVENKIYSNQNEESFLKSKEDDVNIIHRASFIDAARISALPFWLYKKLPENTKTIPKNLFNLLNSIEQKEFKNIYDLIEKLFIDLFNKEIENENNLAKFIT